MENLPGKFRIIFGSGPVGVAASLVLLAVAAWLNQHLGLPPLSDNRALLDAIFLVTCLLTLSVIAWSLASLPAADRGTKLVTSGAFGYVRHPLYAAFVSLFNFGLAIWLNSIIFIIWAILLHPVWQYLVRDEERMMVDIFGQDYIRYQERTGRFFPRLW